MRIPSSVLPVVFCSLFAVVCLSFAYGLQNVILHRVRIDRRIHRQRHTLMRMSPEEERASIFASYLDKAHNAYTRTLEERDNTIRREINALKDDVQQLKNERRPFAESDLAKLQALSKEELAQQIMYYHNTFEQLLANAAEKFNQATESQSAPETRNDKASDTTSLHPDKRFPLYAGRSKAVVAAADAGKSRWGSLEVERTRSMLSAITPVPSIQSIEFQHSKVHIATPPPTSLGSIEKGRAEGPAPTVTQDTLYAKRNAKVLAAAAANQSRWGAMEIHKLQLTAVEVGDASTESSPQEQSYPSDSASVFHDVTIRRGGERNTLYQKRNARVLASAAVGKSRWGSHEVDQIQKLLSQSSREDPVLSAGQVAVNGFVAGGFLETPTKPLYPTIDLPGTKDVLKSVSSDADKLYRQRSASVLASAAVGKSRWGQFEIDRLRDVASSTTKKSTSNVSKPSVILPESKWSLYAQRNAKVLSSAAIGKSRWGQAEIDRLQGFANSPTRTDRAEKGSRSANISEEHPNTKSIPSMESLYIQRNAKVLASAAVGKTRWGQPEIDRLTGFDDPSSRSPPMARRGTNSDERLSSIVEAADRGLRADGGVGGPSLADRLSWGTSIEPRHKEAPIDVGLNNKRLSHYDQRNTRSGKPRGGSPEIEQVRQIRNPMVPGQASLGRDARSVVLESSSTLYARRNARVLASAGVGMSRWGEEELRKLQKQSLGLPVTSKALDPSSVKVKDDQPRFADIGIDMSVNEVEVDSRVKDADHGLRAEGYVGGSTLAERIAMGAAVDTEHTLQQPSHVADNLMQPLAVIPSPQQRTRVNIGENLVGKATSQVATKADSAGVDSINVVSGTNSLPEVIAADHGLRAEGSVLGPTLAERVTFGSTLHTEMRNDEIVSAEVIAADHGLRAEGSVLGPTLAERVTLGSTLHTEMRNDEIVSDPSATMMDAAMAVKSTWGPLVSDSLGSSQSRSIPASDPSKPRHYVNVGASMLQAHGSSGAGALDQSMDATESLDVFPLRNARIIAAADAGSSRWGGEEIARIRQSLQPAASRSIHHVLDLEHAQDDMRPSTKLLYERRNERVLAAAHAGKTRWGPREVSRIQALKARGPT